MSSTLQNPELVKLTAEIEDFRARTGMTATAFGKWAVNDPSLIRDIQRGRDLRWQTIASIREKMAAGVSA